MLPQRKHLRPGEGPSGADAKVLTDDFAPVEALKAIKEHNRKWLEQ